ncbi:MAG: hypothetical protein AB7P03_19385 [Kofleriaceae bacterium]
MTMRRKPDRGFARDVAKQIERRARRRKLLLLLLLAAAILLAFEHLTCGNGFGLGGLGLGGEGEGSGATTAPATTPGTDAGMARCSIRVSSTGITVDGKSASREQAIEACKATSGADVVITGDARQGDWSELEAALQAANITIYKRAPKPTPAR